MSVCPPYGLFSSCSPSRPFQTLADLPTCHSDPAEKSHLLGEVFPPHLDDPCLGGNSVIPSSTFFIALTSSGNDWPFTLLICSLVSPSLTAVFTSMQAAGREPDLCYSPPSAQRSPPSLAQVCAQRCLVERECIPSAGKMGETILDWPGCLRTPLPSGGTHSHAAASSPHFHSLSGKQPDSLDQEQFHGIGPKQFPYREPR